VILRVLCANDFFLFVVDLGQPDLEMKTLKVSAVATIALTLAWWVRIPHRMWPAHPIMADILIGIILCIVLQVLWVEPKTPKKK